MRLILNALGLLSLMALSHPAFSGNARIERNPKLPATAIHFEPAYLGETTGSSPKPHFRLLIPDFNDTVQQQDMHVLQIREENSENFKTLMIDAGHEHRTRAKLLAFLKSHQISHIDEIYITHPHKDHYGGLYPLLESEVSIGLIVMNTPQKDICDREKPWGCDFDDLMRLKALILGKGIALKEMWLGEVKHPVQIHKDPHTEIQLIHASPPVTSYLGDMDINDLSLIMTVRVDRARYLFTGDLNAPLSDYLAEREPDLGADLLKAPHHGTEGTASNRFLDRVGAHWVLVPSPEGLWCSDRSSRLRDYFKAHNAEVIVSGFHGETRIEHFGGGRTRIMVERNAGKSPCG